MCSVPAHIGMKENPAMSFILDALLKMLSSFRMEKRKFGLLIAN